MLHTLHYRLSEIRTWAKLAEANTAIKFGSVGLRATASASNRCDRTEMSHFYIHIK
jgi:hypothetical protein